MKYKYTVLFICEILSISISINLFFISIDENLRDKYFCREFEKLAEELSLSDNKQEIIKKALLNKINWNIPHKSDTSGTILAIYLYIFFICLLPLFVLFCIQHFFIKKKYIYFHILFLSLCIILIISPTICIINYTIRIIKPIKIKKYLIKDKKMISLLTNKKLELNVRTIKMVLSTLLILVSLIILIIEIIFIIRDKKYISKFNSIYTYSEKFPIIESETIQFKNNTIFK